MHLLVYLSMRVQRLSTNFFLLILGKLRRLLPRCRYPTEIHNLDYEAVYITWNNFLLYHYVLLRHHYHRYEDGHFFLRESHEWPTLYVLFQYFLRKGYFQETVLRTPPYPLLCLNVFLRSHQALLNRLNHILYTQVFSSPLSKLWKLPFDLPLLLFHTFNLSRFITDLVF